MADTDRADAHAAAEWTVGSVLRWATQDFAQRGLTNPRLDAELLLAAALGVDRIRLIIDSKRLLEPGELSAYRASIRRRRAGEPVAYILGEREFFGLPIHVDARVLIPRPDTEILVEAALTRTAERCMYGRALDLCTGSGCVAIAFAKARPTWRITALDVSAAALGVAQSNALRAGSIWGVRFVQGDLFAGLAAAERFELITANPPYVPSAEVDGLDPGIRDFEPRLALDGGEDGLTLVRRILEEAPGRLVPKGLLAMEIGAGQSGRVRELFAGAGLVEIELHRDYGGHERVVSGRKA
ncbi:MAG TPA: peptide chain release factor N(5)-glutamine methyltransferase [Polyangiaceae bacterium]